MNKKAEVNGVFLGAIIFVALLALYFIFINPSGDGTFGKIFSFFKNTPDFNGTLTDKTEIGLIRYDIQDNKVQMYDGQSWKDFTGGKDFESLGTSLTAEEIRSTFDKYYFEGQRTDGGEVFKNQDFSVSISGLAKNSAPAYDRSWYEASFVGGNLQVFTDWISNNPTYFDNVDYNRGTVILNIWRLNQAGSIESIAGFIFVDLNGGLNPLDGGTSFEVEQTNQDSSSKLDFFKTLFGDSPSFNPSEQEIIKSKVTLWRDSVFKEPKINLKGKDFCFRKVGTSYLTDGRYIAIDLNRAGGDCNV